MGRQANAKPEDVDATMRRLVDALVDYYLSEEGIWEQRQLLQALHTCLCFAENPFWPRALKASWLKTELARAQREQIAAVGSINLRHEDLVPFQELANRLSAHDLSGGGDARSLFDALPRMANPDDAEFEQVKIAHAALIERRCRRLSYAKLAEKFCPVEYATSPHAATERLRRRIKAVELLEQDPFATSEHGK